jgi:transmembrane sensor
MNIPIYDRLAELAFKKISGRLSEEEEHELNGIFEKWPDKKELFDEMTNPAYAGEQLMIINELDVDASWEKLNQDAPPHRKRWGGKQYLMAAASVVLVACLITFLILRSGDKRSAIVKGANKSTTANAVIIDSVAKIVGGDGTEIVVGKSQSGIVAYIEDKPVQMKDHILIVPDVETRGPVIKALPGKELQVQLSDGTRVWLSGSSELNFHEGFTTAKKTLALKGEAYFEVTKGTGAHFAVNAHGMKATALGTMFTISAYDKGAVTTSLFEGKLNLNSGQKNMLLLKNEGAVWANNEFTRITLPKSSIDKVEGKKTGFFIFEDKIKVILDEVAKNYDRSIVYKGNIPDSEYSGSFSRNMPIDSLLTKLSASMVIDLSLQENKIIADFTKSK